MVKFTCTGLSFLAPSVFFPFLKVMALHCSFGLTSVSLGNLPLYWALIDDAIWPMNLQRFYCGAHISHMHFNIVESCIILFEMVSSLSNKDGQKVFY